MEPLRSPTTQRGGYPVQLVGDNAINDVFEVDERSVIVAGHPAAV